MTIEQELEMANLMAFNQGERADELEDAALFAIAVLGKISAFGDGIGDAVSKAEIGVARQKLISATQWPNAKLNEPQP